MSDTYISFYLGHNRIHIFVDALRKIGSPKRICFMLDRTGESLLLVPYEKRDLKSHKVPPKVYQGNGQFNISSMKLCQIIAGLHHWDITRSYRIPGKIISEQHLVMFHLPDAVLIEHPE